jgi:hypothetical protein
MGVTYRGIVISMRNVNTVFYATHKYVYQCEGMVCICASLEEAKASIDDRITKFMIRHCLITKVLTKWQ